MGPYPVETAVCNSHFISLECVPDTDCMNGQAKYLTDREALIDAQLACTTDMDCSVLLPVERCGAPNCDFRAVSADAVDSRHQALSNLADKDCSACMGLSLPACDLPTAACVESVCVLVQ